MKVSSSKIFGLDILREECYETIFGCPEPHKIEFETDSENKKNEEKRNFRIDNLKCLAIFSAILAHMGLPTLLLNIRTYDVVLLFLLAGMNSVSKINPNSINLYPDKNLLWKRCKKLLLPAWGMMFLVWAVVAIGCLILHKE